MAIPGHFKVVVFTRSRILSKRPLSGGFRQGANCSRRFRQGDFFRQFYESALNDHENAFRNIMKTHEKSVQKRMEKVYKNAWTKSTNESAPI